LVTSLIAAAALVVGVVAGGAGGFAIGTSTVDQRPTVTAGIDAGERPAPPDGAGAGERPGEVNRGQGGPGSAPDGGPESDDS
tara:strand:- start:14153 stop:14398 length:246 start_codon:yes stop_codon:yes gene_type:complete